MRFLRAPMFNFIFMSKIRIFDTYHISKYLSYDSSLSKPMAIKHLKDKKILDMNGFLLHLEIYDNEIIIKDEYLNSMRITKKNLQSIVLVLNGYFSSKK